MKVDRYLTIVLSSGLMALLLLASIQSPIAQTTSNSMMKLGDSYALDLNTQNTETLNINANTINATTGAELGGFKQSILDNVYGTGKGELFVVENLGSNTVGGILLGETTASPGSSYNYSSLTWYNTTGKVSNDSYSDDLTGMVRSLSKNFNATYNSTYSALFESALLTEFALVEFPGVYFQLPMFDFNLGEFLSDLNVSTIPRTSILVQNITIPWMGQNVTVRLVESTFELPINYTNVLVSGEVPATYGNWYLVNITGSILYSVSMIFNITDGTLFAFEEFFDLAYGFIGISTTPPLASQLNAIGDAETSFNLFYAKNVVIYANTTQANFGPNNPAPSIDPNYPFNYSDRILYDIEDYTYGYLTSYIKDTNGNVLNAFVADYSELFLGDLELYFAYTDSGIFLNSLLDQTIEGYATYGVIYSGDRDISSVENRGYLNGTGLVWENGTVYSETYTEFGYDKLVVPYNSTHPIIERYRPSIYLFDLLTPDMDIPFLEFVDNGTIPLTSLTSYTYNLYLDVNNNTNYPISALEFIGVYDKNRITTVTNYEIPGTEGNFNLTVIIYFWYAEYYTYDTVEGMLVLFDQFAGLNITVNGPGKIMIPGQSTPTDVTFEYRYNLNYQLERTLVNIPHYYQSMPTPTSNATLPTNTTPVTPTNTSSPANINTTTPAGSSTFLPGFGLYVSASAIFIPVAITILRRNK